MGTNDNAHCMLHWISLSVQTLKCVSFFYDKPILQEGWLYSNWKQRDSQDSRVISVFCCSVSWRDGVPRKAVRPGHSSEFKKILRGALQHWPILLINLQTTIPVPESNTCSKVTFSLLLPPHPGWAAAGKPWQRAPTIIIFSSVPCFIDCNAMGVWNMRATVCVFVYSLYVEVGGLSYPKA